MNTDEELFLVSYNETSKRHAILSDEGHVVFLYLHAPSNTPDKTSEVTADVVVCNRVELIDSEEVTSYRPKPPPITKNYGNEESIIKDTKKELWEFAWSENGESVVLLRNNEPWSLIREDEKKGYTKAISVSGPWGEPWNEKLINKIC